MQFYNPNHICNVNYSIQQAYGEWRRDVYDQWKRDYLKFMMINTNTNNQYK